MARSGLKLLGMAAVALWLGNSSWLWGQPGQTRALSHRGLHQQFSRDGLTGETCTAAAMRPSGHDFLENTIPSMQAAFAAGAEVVELDIALTADGQFAVFHDWTLHCRTDGTGEIRDWTMAELKELNIGFGYTADGGLTYPHRGRGQGLMPELSEVFGALPPEQLLINFKTGDAVEGTALALWLAERDVLPWGVYGDVAPVAAAKAALPGLRGFSRDSLKDCLLPYLALGWSGHVPLACRGAILAVPSDLAPLLWGWPHLFTARMRGAGSEVILMGPWAGGGGFSQGIDDPSALEAVPKGLDALVWTNRAEVLAPLLQGHK